MEVTAFDIAMKFAGLREVAGSVNNPQIMAMLQLDNSWPSNDETPWCSAFVGYIAFLLDLPRTRDLRARSWLTVGTPIEWEEARAGFDIVILKRGGGDQPGPDVIDAPGHVGFFSRSVGNLIEVLGGNQGDSVKLSNYNGVRLLGIRRLYE